jgi:hypothetical protein
MKNLHHFSTSAQAFLHHFGNFSMRFDSSKSSGMSLNDHGHAGRHLAQTPQRDRIDNGGLVRAGALESQHIAAVPQLHVKVR